MIRRLLSIALVLIPLLTACRPTPSAIAAHAAPLGRLPHIDPDYTGIVLPPNIAPLNFKVMEPCRSFIAEFASRNGASFSVSGTGTSVRIPLAKWRKLLAANEGEPLRITLYLQQAATRWVAAEPIVDTIAAAPIDHYATYRVLSFQYNYSSDIRIHERDLESFHERTLLNSANYNAWGCCNCHTPNKNDPSSFVVQSRSKRFGSATLIGQNGKLSAVLSRLGYASWCPDGKRIAFSVYKVQQCFHAVGGNFIDVYDQNAGLVIYDVAKRTVDAVPTLMDQRFLQTWPAWSPDGKWLYYCSAPILWADFTQTPPENYDKVKYALCRIHYNEADNSWGEIDTVLSPRQTGLSIAQPRISPDGRFLLFCMQERGAYPHTQKSSDLYLMDLGTGKYRRLAVNSEYNESWHGWSSNGRWILFSTKRGGGLFTKLYFSYIDNAGIEHKPFILPQEDPAFYDSFIKCFNVPEFATAPVPFDQRDLLKAIRSRTKTKVPVPAAVPLSAPNPNLQ